MQIISKDMKIDVGRLTSLLLQRKITKPRFRFPLTKEQAYDVLLAAYKAEVEYRHREFIADRHCLASISRLAEVLTSENPKFGIMLCGTLGNGKTTLLYALCSALHYLNALSLFEENMGIVILGAKDIAAQSKSYERFREIRSYPMLAIDDMGREPKEVLDFGNVLSPIIDLLEYRYHEQLFTIITTNLNSEEIKERYKARIADRFNEMLEVIIFEDGSYRSQKSK